jgi:hypothetical protein
MERFVDERNLPGSQPRLQGPTDVAAYVFIILFLVQCGLILAGYWLGISGFPNARWFGEALLLLAAASTLSSLARWLPWQNVALGALLIGLMGALIEVVGISTGTRPGLDDSRSAVGQLFSIHQAWPIPLVWIVAILNCRGAARFLLQPWQEAPTYGFWLLGFTVFLVVPLILGFARFGPLALPYFSAASRNMRLDWQTAGTLLVCAVGTFLILLIVTPSLINKRPTPQPADWHPLVLWAAFNLLFLTGAVGQHAWFAVAHD